MDYIKKLYPQNDEKMIEVNLDKEHFPFKMLDQHEMVKKFINGERISPIHCRVGLTSKCNYRCKFCNFHSENERDFYDEFSFKDVLDKELMERFLLEFSNNGGKAITFCGSGEPTIHPDYYEICNYANKLGLQIGLITNGSMLTNNRIFECVKRTHTWLRVGMNAATQNTYSAITGSNNSLIKMLEAFGNLKKDNTTEEFKIGFNFVITLDNYKEILAAAKLAKKYNADYIRFEPEFYSALAHQTIYDEIKQIEKQLMAAKGESNERFEVSIPKLNRGAMTKTDKIEGDFDICYYSDFVTALGANGCMYPCPQIHLNNEYNMGDILDGYENWLNSENRKCWKEVHKDRKEMCKTCFYRPQNEMLSYLKKGTFNYDEIYDSLKYREKIIHKNFV